MRIYAYESKITYIPAVDIMKALSVTERTAPCFTSPPLQRTANGRPYIGACVRGGSVNQLAAGAEPPPYSANKEGN